MTDHPRWAHWPANCTPSNSPIYALNELQISAPAEAVWEWLVRAPLWPGWYANARDVRILEGPDPQRLAAGSRFGWRTSNTLWRPVETTVDVCEPLTRLGWGAGDGLARLPLLAARARGRGLPRGHRGVPGGPVALARARPPEARPLEAPPALARGARAEGAERSAAIDGRRNEVGQLAVSPVRPSRTAARRASWRSSA